ncbi:MAG: hypothetical protein ACFFFT_10645 [Candidatus Thorarchaeota archaeon]
MNELHKIGDLNQVFSNIDEEIKSIKPSTKRIITYLYDLRTKEEFQGLSDSKFYDFIGEIFKLNPEFFMKSIYREMLSGKLFRKVNLMEMEKYIIEKFCLYEGEQILYESNGKIEENNFLKNRRPVKISVDGRIYVTNYRVIAHGKFSVKGGEVLIDLFSLGRAQKAKGKGDFVGSSTSQELPCYGFQFEITNHFLLKKLYANALNYRILNIDTLSAKKKQIRITLPSQFQRNNLFKVLTPLGLPTLKKKDYLKKK